MYNTFVVTCKSFNERHVHMEKQLKLYNIEWEYVFDYDCNNIPHNYKCKFSNRLSPGEISCFCKHLSIWDSQKLQQTNCVLILEDDVKLCNDFINKLNIYTHILPVDYDMLFIGDGCDLHIPLKQQTTGINIYKKCNHATKWGGDGCTRCTDSYIISPKCAYKLYEHFSNEITSVDLPLDWWMNKAARFLDLDVYWLEPTIVTQNQFESSIRHT